MRSTQTWAIYSAGFIGAFNGQALVPVMPEFAGSFGISVEQASLTMSAYLFPFAGMMLISGRLVQRLPPHRVVLTAIALSLPLSGLLILTADWYVFLLGYAVLGVINAFTTPVLQNILRELTPPQKLGAALGTYASFQALGVLAAPLVAGLTALVSWRLTFVVTVLVAVFVLVVRLPHTPPPTMSPQKVEGRIAWSRVLAQMLTNAIIGIGILGLGFLTSLHVGDQFGLGPVRRGVLLVCGGAAAFLTARRVGAAADSYGTRTVVVGGAILGTASLALLPILPLAAAVAIAWACAVVAAQAMQTAVNIEVLTAPGGASMISTVQAARFFGAAASPVLALPLYSSIGAATFWVAAASIGAIVIARSLMPR